MGDYVEIFGEEIQIDNEMERELLERAENIASDACDFAAYLREYGYKIQDDRLISDNGISLT